MRRNQQKEERIFFVLRALEITISLKKGTETARLIPLLAHRRQYCQSSSLVHGIDLSTSSGAESSREKKSSLVKV